jgi:hypothetical protein
MSVLVIAMAGGIAYAGKHRRGDTQAYQALL